MLEILDLYCKLKAGISVYEALFNDPQLILEALKSMYPDSGVISFYVREVFVKPIFANAQDTVNYEDLVELLIKKPAEFKKRLENALRHLAISSEQ